MYLTLSPFIQQRRLRSSKTFQHEPCLLPLSARRLTGNVVPPLSRLLTPSSGGALRLPQSTALLSATPILCRPHEYISGGICVGGRPTFISYSGAVLCSKRDAPSRLRPDPSPHALPCLFPENFIGNMVFFSPPLPGAAEETPAGKGKARSE